MSDSLQTGTFYGAARGRLELCDVVLTEVTHTCGRKLPRHTHESAYFGLLLSGSYAERCTDREAQYQPFTIGFHPPSLTHSDEVGMCGSRMFCLELRDAYLERTRPFLTRPRFVPDLCASEVTWLALRLYRSFAERTLTVLELEEFCGDMLERVGGGTISEERSRPKWLSDAVDLLNESFRQPLTLDGIAAQVGVHPIHLSRVFRKQFGSSMSDYLNRRRVQYACQALASGWADLSGVAADAGFADQSHLGRVFKACTGQTPGKFRSFSHLRRAVT